MTITTKGPSITVNFCFAETRGRAQGLVNYRFETNPVVTQVSCTETILATCQGQA